MSLELWLRNREITKRSHQVVCFQQNKGRSPAVRQWSVGSTKRRLSIRFGNAFKLPTTLTEKL
jgi:hypothetical protein